MDPRSAARTEVDGVPVCWVPTDDSTMTVTLTFGVGWRDESPHTVGVSHLVEHIVMRAVGRLTIPHNATTDTDAIRFFAVGDAAQIVDFVARVCTGIRSLDRVSAEVVDAEKRVVSAELGESGNGNHDGAFRRIFGLAGIGLAEYGQPAHRSFTSEKVTRFAAEWMHSGNVVVTITGTPPAGLRLDLPRGTAPTRQHHPPPVLPDFPCWISVWASPVSFTFVSQGSWAARSLASVALEQMLYDSLRVRKGHIYSTAAWSTRLDPLRSLVRIELDPDADNVEPTMVEATAIIRDFAEFGPSAAVLDRARETLLATLEPAAAAGAWLQMQALCLVRGWPVLGLEEARHTVASVTPDEVRAVLQQFASSMVLATRIDSMSEQTAAALALATPRWVPLTPNVSVRGVFSDVLSGAAVVLDPARGEKALRGHQLHVTATHLSLLGSGNEVVGQAAINDIVLVRRYPNGVLGFDFSNGLTFALRPAAWKDPKGSITTALARIPAELVISAT